MVPAQVVVLAAMPMTANGKIDRKALPPPERRRDEAAGYVEPRTDSERLVARTWAEVLRLDRVGALDDFFALGGHSLQAVEIVHALEAATGRRLPLSVLLAAPTVAALAAELGDAAGTSLLVQLRGGDGPTVFCLHPSGGEVLHYRALAQRLPVGWPVIGVRSRALLGDGEHIDLADMAQDYAEALTAAQPDGPFLLLGWSLGGVVAHAVASVLRARARAVAFVGLIDASLPSERPDHTEHPFWRLAAAFGALAGAVAELPRAEREAAVAEVLALPEDHRPGAALRIAVASGLVPDGATQSAFAAQTELARTHEALLLAHRPPVVDVNLHVVWAQETLVDGKAPTDWAAATTGRVASRTVPGNHYTLLGPSGLDAFTGELARQLELAVEAAGRAAAFTAAWP